MDNKNNFTGLNNLNMGDLLKLQPSIIQQPLMNNNNFKALEDVANQINRQKTGDRQVQKNIETNTKKIADNTEWLSQTVNLIRINGERQTELLQILSEIFALSNLNDMEVAEGKLTQILNKVQGFKDNYELIIFLKNLGSTLIKFAVTGDINLPD